MRNTFTGIQKETRDRDAGSSKQWLLDLEKKQTNNKKKKKT